MGPGLGGLERRDQPARQIDVRGFDERVVAPVQRREVDDRIALGGELPERPVVAEYLSRCRDHDILAVRMQRAA